MITGATDGIGRQTALELVRAGASVIVHGRNGSGAGAVLEEMHRYSGNGHADYIAADLSSLSEVEAMAEKLNGEYEKIDVLINNAGVFVRGQEFSDDGYEMTFAVNHLSHFALALQLLPLLKKAGKARVVTVSSVAHTNSPRIDFTDITEINAYIDYSAYALSKMANVMFSHELAKRLQGHMITSNSLHPGVVSTKLLHAGFGITGSSTREGSKTSVFLASDPSVDDITGKYFSDGRLGDPSSFSFDPQYRKNLWELSEELTGIRMNDFV